MTKERQQSFRCSRCKGVGVSFWDSFTDGFTNIFGLFFGEMKQTKCKMCNGTGITTKQ